MLTNNERKTLSNLKKDSNIKIVPADKGNTTVVMNKADYEAKIQDHLSNANTY